MDPILVQIQAEIYAEQARMLGMHAENMQRQVNGDSMAYTESDFLKVADALFVLGNHARQRL